jgi:DNA-binding NarL/FixJ family response regulator
VVAVLLARAELGVAVRERAPGAAVRARLAEARALAERLGLRGLAERAAERLDARPTAAPRLPAGLTGREAEVLRLVTAGRSNRQIAEQLVLSEKTVANHLTSIFNKTGADNRAAATAFAVRQGLA